MPDLVQSLYAQDLGHLKIIAELWGIELIAPDFRTGLNRLVELLADRSHFAEMAGELPEPAWEALHQIAKNGGRMPWAAFTRLHGEVREMGVARRDREKPYADPQIGAAETLWYRGLIGRAFFDTPKEPIEFAYIPDEFLLLIPSASQDRINSPPGRPAIREETKFILPADDRILDDACTLLSGLRLGMEVDQLDPWMTCAAQSEFPLQANMLKMLLQTGGLIDPQGSLLTEPIRNSLEARRGESLTNLFRAWRESQVFNELMHLPGIQAEGEWKNDPLSARQAILDFMMAVPGWTRGKGVSSDRPFWSLASFISWIREHFPDFLRPAGDYDSWFLSDQKTGGYLRGFENWDRVEGALVRYLISGPLHWLSVLDLGFAESTAKEHREASSFRFSSSAESILNDEIPDHLPDESEPLIVNSDGHLIAHRYILRSIRYQIARFCEWDRVSRDSYHYFLTPASLKTAGQQGLTVQHLLSILGKAAEATPPSLIKALKRWESAGREARFEQATLLRVTSPEIIQQLRVSRGARFLGEPLNPTTIIIRPGAWKKVAGVLAEMGVLSEAEHLENGSLQPIK